MKSLYQGGELIDFEWIVVDDGSDDDTFGLVKEWCDENKIAIRYYYQENKGKHVAINRGVKNARGVMWQCIDSDDSIFSNALCVFYEEWMKIPENERSGFKGVVGRCIDPSTGQVIGKPFPRYPYRTSPQDMRFRDHITGEMVGCTRIDVMKEFPFPEFNDKTSFCPENIVWMSMGKKYIESYINVPLREYYRDAANAITKGGGKNRAKANYYLWQWNVNNLVGEYLFRSPKEMLKSVIGVSMDGLRTGRSLNEILKGIDASVNKALVALFSPLGWLLSKL